MESIILWHYQILGTLLLSVKVACALSWPNTSSSSVGTNSIHHFPSSQSLKLLQFKNSLVVDSFASEDYCLDSFNKTETWKESVDCCNWDGVTCDKLTGNVIGLDLGCSNLLGEINSNNSLFQLPYLRSLNLAFNNFDGSPIPLDFGRIASSLTHLNLSTSGFSGLVPVEISQLSRLVQLDLSDSYNQLQLGSESLRGLLHNLTGLSDLVLDEIDMSLVALDSFMNASSSLRSLSLSGCGLQGNLPEDIFCLPNLQQLVLSYNFQLFGSFPKFNWTSPLRILDVSVSGFSGNLPASIGSLKSLVSLDFTSCNFSGPLPASIGNLTKLTSLVLYLNNFTGQIPSGLSNLESLLHLNLGLNGFSGEIPDAFHNLSNLVEFVMEGNNHLSGRIPPSLFTLKDLAILSLGNNQLSGPLSYDQEINGLLSLTSIDLSFNVLNGTVTPYLFALPSLTTVDLSYNQFTGLIPDLLSPSLVAIKLANNKMHGAIPSSIFQLVNASIIDVSSNNFSGNMNLDLFSELGNLVELHLSGNSLSVEVNLRSDSSRTWPMIQYLHLSSCNISSFPEFLSSQSQLKSLILSSNKIDGEIPEWLWLIGNASLDLLDLSHNFLTGMAHFPVQQIRILYLDLSFNSITGSISPLMDAIDVSWIPTFFSLSSNKFTGEIPSTICNFSSLGVIDLSNNSFSGGIPECLGSLASLSVLNLRMNSISGFMPQNFSVAKFLRNLDFNGNHLEGTLPRSLKDCKKLEVLDLGNNRINDSFPHWLESLPQLQVLILRANSFGGPLASPSTTSPFPKLRILDIASNDFIGPLPGRYFGALNAMINVDGGTTKEEKYMGDRNYRDSMVVTIKGQNIVFERIFTIFATMDFSDNKFKGRIPDNVGSLQSLQGLNFSHNILSGSIPSSLANLTEVESLDLSSNQLAEEIPPQLANLRFLSALNLSNNQLTGPIPRGPQFDTFTNNSYQSNPGLCGQPLSKQCGNVEAASQQEPAIQNEDGSDPSKFDWKIAMMGYGSGLAIGFSATFFVFMRGEPLWFARIADRLANPHYKKMRRQQRRQKERTRQNR